MIIRGSLERLSPILMTALATGLALVPIVAAGVQPEREIEHPHFAVVIVGGLVTSTLLTCSYCPRFTFDGEWDEEDSCSKILDESAA